MAATEISRNAETRFCRFVIDSEEDLSKLPTTTSFGKSELSTSSTCCQGSIAKSLEDGTIYILTGTNTWNISVGHGCASGSDGDGSDEYAFINSLFGITDNNENGNNSGD